MKIYEGKSKNLKKVLRFAKIVWDGKENDYVAKGLYNDIVRTAAGNCRFDGNKEIEVLPCIDNDFFESGSVTSDANNAMLVISSSREGHRGMDSIYKSMFESNLEYWIKQDDFSIFVHLRTKYNLLLIAYDEHRTCSGWVISNEINSLIAVELIERFRQEHGDSEVVDLEEYDNYIIARLLER